jgi:hypothetical protein
MASLSISLSNLTQEALPAYSGPLINNVNTGDFDIPQQPPPSYSTYPVTSESVPIDTRSQRKRRLRTWLRKTRQILGFNNDNVHPTIPQEAPTGRDPHNPELRRCGRILRCCLKGAIFIWDVLLVVLVILAVLVWAVVCPADQPTNNCW